MEQQQGGFISIVASTSRMISECVSVRMRDTSTGWFAFHGWWLCGLCICQNEGNLYKVIWFSQWLIMWPVFLSESRIPLQGDSISIVDGLCFCQNQGYLHRVILFPQWMDCVSVRIKDTSTGWFDFHNGWLCGLCFCQNQGYLHRVIRFPQWMDCVSVRIRGYLHRVILFPQWMVMWLCFCQNQECLYKVIFFPQWMFMWTVSLSESGGSGRFHWTQTIYHHEICSATSSQSSRSCI